jgi:uncharacterized protein YecT (DUF1311 family)
MQHQQHQQVARSPTQHQNQQVAWLRTHMQAAQGGAVTHGGMMTHVTAAPCKLQHMFPRDLILKHPNETLATYV